MTLWVQTVRAPIMPDPTDIPPFTNGSFVFEANCATCHAGAQIRSHSANGLTLDFLEGVGTFNMADSAEIRGQPPTAGITALGGLGFNVPSLLGAGYHAPYLHIGAAQTFDDVFALHSLSGRQFPG